MREEIAMSYELTKCLYYRVDIMARKILWLVKMLLVRVLYLSFKAHTRIRDYVNKAVF